MPELSVLLLAACIFFGAALYTSVGHAGASAYIALMAIFGMAPVVMRPTALALNDGDGGIMAKDDDTASKRLADETARDRATINLQRAFDDLVPKLNRAYGQPARDEADERSQHVVALRAIAAFLEQVGPDYLAHFADQFAKLAQRLQDLNEGRRVPMLYPAIASRADQTVVWLARAYVALAVETLRWCGHSRPSAAEWAAKAASRAGTVDHREGPIP
jgi:hypothetical protein